MREPRHVMRRALSARYPLHCRVVPSNIEQCKKWIAAIPGIVDLKPSQFVCEKHFEERYILRKWVKYHNGRVIAESKVENITIAADSSIDQRISAEHSYCSLDEPSSNQLMDTTVDESSNEKIHSPMFRLPSSTEFSSIALIEEPSFVQDVRTNGSVMDGVDVKSTNRILQHEDLSPRDVATVESIQEQQVQDRPVEHCAPEVRDRCFHSSQVTVSYDTPGGTTDSTWIPWPWAIGELSTDIGSFLFTYAVTKMENGDKFPVVEKNVKLCANKELRYFVYGRAVDVHGCKLPQILEDIASLPQALKKFQNMNMCNGLGTINVHHLSADSAFKDSVDQWRHKNCTLISKQKRCGHCMKMRNVVQKKEARLKMKRSLERPLADSYTQPIAVFASKNPVKGDELAKLVIKAIAYLERTGAKIHGVITDGAATNANMRSLLGVSGSMEDTKTWFTNPVFDNRKVYVFSDAPHVIKNVRNRLHNKKKLFDALNRKTPNEGLTPENKDFKKFFGTIRQAAGCNDHPNSPTFLQLYKLLSVYSIIKPPKFGNCTVSEQPSPQLLLSLQDLKTAYGQKSEAKSVKYGCEIRAKLDEILQHDDWEADDVIENNHEHDYALSPILDCIIYYVTGFLF
ncbi:tigger transposable element-derived protein 7-like protein [Lasius niger]|uniref:Tigger transposable element-derived protein 7-like protein n=1 Tax=Lasius niger TaxID=67767 RepID=A0A0J7KI49_LASNI|nr:tigger transposable element-derived protein 7-like protein [Lasius niger]